jgi:hypothetical protein
MDTSKKLLKLKLRANAILKNYDEKQSQELNEGIERKLGEGLY